MDVMRKYCRTGSRGGPYYLGMINAEGVPTRTLTIVLPESDWRALRAAEPDAVAWLQARIRERLASESGAASYSASTISSDNWAEDEY
jgi:hypothetical protein